MNRIIDELEELIEEIRNGNCTTSDIVYALENIIKIVLNGDD